MLQEMVRSSARTPTVRARAAARRARRRLRAATDNGLLALGVHQSEPQLIADAARYWADEDDPLWRDQSHWRGGQMIDDAQFRRIGDDHLALFDQLAASVGGRADLGRVLDWGCGGGANAVAFAPRASEYVGVDVSPTSLAECRRQLSAVDGTPFVEVPVSVADPEAALPRIPGAVDLFLCLYVLELVPTPEYGLRLLRIAQQSLRPGGLAFVQFKYATGTLGTRAKRRDYRRHCSNMTTYRLEDFWTVAGEAGLAPIVMTLVPENGLDRRYAYLLLERRGSLPASG